MDPTAELISSHTPRRSYSIQYLKSFAERCRSSPPNVDLREINSELLSTGSPDSRSRGDVSLTPGSGTRNGRRRKARSRRRSQGKVAHQLGSPGGWCMPSVLSGSDTSNSSTANTSLSSFKQSLPPLKLSDKFPHSPDKNISTEEIKTSSSDEFYSPQADRVDISSLCSRCFSRHAWTSSSTCSNEQKIDLGVLFVKERHRALPMPAARTLQDIESEMITSDMKKTESFLTCEAVEQSILADSATEYYSSPTADSLTSRERWQGGEDKAASKHLMSVLQKKPRKKPGTIVSSDSEKELLGELISSSPISDDLSNLNGILKRYERIAAADFERAVSECKQQALGEDGQKTITFACSSSVDSVRTSVKEQSPKGGEAPPLSKTCSTDDKTGKLSNRTSRKFVQAPVKAWQCLGGIQPSWNMVRPAGFMTLAPPPPPPPNAFVQTRPTGETPLVPQALHALQKLVDHQLHILNSIPGEVTPGMLHERLSRSVLGYPPTGTQLLLATSGYPVLSSRFV